MKKYSIEIGNKVKRNSTTSHCRINQDIHLVVLGMDRELNYKLKGQLKNICLSIHFSYYTKLSQFLESFQFPYLNILILKPI